MATTITTSEHQNQYLNVTDLTKLASGSFGLIRYAHRKSGEATKYVISGLNENLHVTPVIDVTKKAAIAVKDSQLVQSTVGSAGQWTSSTIGYISGAGYRAASSTVTKGQQLYHHVSNSPITGKLIGFAGAAIGSAVTMNMMATSAASTAGMRLIRGSCIRNSLWIFNKLGLPNAMRATAVYAGVQTNNYIVSGLIPGMFIVWAAYDGYRLARFAYNKYQERCLPTHQENTPVHYIQILYPEDYTHIQYFGMYAPQ